MTLSPLILVALGTVALLFYINRKFQWMEISRYYYLMEYKLYAASIVIDSQGFILMSVKCGERSLFKVSGAESIKWAKKKAEQVILEDEERLERITVDELEKF